MPLKNFLLLLSLLLLTACAQAKEPIPVSEETPKPANVKQMPDSYWKEKLDANVYQVTRCSATEPAFSGKYWNHHEDGTYRCSNCGEVLFDSKDKFDSGTGWPSFTQAQGKSVDTKRDQSLGMVRDEIICSHCGAHLGHVFPDGPAPGGQRYCVNSASLNFSKDKQSK